MLSRPFASIREPKRPGFEIFRIQRSWGALMIDIFVCEKSCDFFKWWWWRSGAHVPLNPPPLNQSLVMKPVPSTKSDSRFRVKTTEIGFVHRPSLKLSACIVKITIICYLRVRYLIKYLRYCAMLPPLVRLYYILYSFFFLSFVLFFIF